MITEPNHQSSEDKNYYHQDKKPASHGDQNVARKKYHEQREKFSFKNPWLLISTIGGIGLSKIAPGTMGTIIGGIVAYILFPYFSFSTIWLIGLLLFIIGWIASSASEKIYNVKDSSSIVIDEFVAIWLVLSTVYYNWQWFLVAIIIFRIFDIVKPYPIKMVEQKFPSGFGVMIDDIVAGIYSIIVLLIINGIVNFLSY